MESQSLRAMRRYLDYGQRCENRQGMEELYRWIGRILLDDGQVYSPEEQALAFEVAVCERLADLWPAWQDGDARQVVVSGDVDKVFLYRQMLARESPFERVAAFWKMLAEKYKKQAAWIGERVAAREDPVAYETSGCLPLLEGFLQKMEEVAALPDVVGNEKSSQLERELEGAREENRKQDGELAELREELEFAEDRASRAHQRLKKLDEEVKQLRKQLREARENGGKLRNERRGRIQSQRQASQASRELEHLKGEYVKMDQRLKQMAQRLAQTEQHRFASSQSGDSRVDLSALHQLEAGKLLGVEGELSNGDLGRIRRRFAAVFHPDRINQLPAWARSLCDEVMGVINDACDRAGKR